MGSLRTRTIDAMGRQRREGWLQHCPLSYDQARCSHPPFAECYAIQAFSIASDFDPQLMPKIQNQIPCFASSKSPFGLQLGLRETPHASHHETEEERCLRRNQRLAARPKAYVDLQPLGLSWARKSPARLSSPHWVLNQDTAQICKSFSKPVALQIRHTQTPVACTLDRDLPTDHRPCTSPEQSGEGSLKRQPMCLRQRKYSQSVKNQEEDVHGARLCPAL